jgi:uncharacterized protein YwqG
MSFFKKLFGKKDNLDERGGQVSLTPAEFFATGDIKALLSKYKRPATLLRPHKSEIPVSHLASKFGGIPNFAGFDVYPCCDACNTPLNFVLQLYKNDFPAFYFPGDSSLFQLFRCPNNDCPDACSEMYDQKMFHYYFNPDKDNKILSKPTYNLPNAESEVPDCYLKSKVVDDFPNYDDFEDDDFVDIEKKYGDDLSGLFMDNYSALPNSKFGGYPGFTQAPFYPTCTCGKTKEFFFQLSSEDPEESTEQRPSPGTWSPHGIMIGDVGNIYYYVCKSCGPKTIESYWDCS